MLRTVLRANALSCLIFGAWFLIDGPSIGLWLGSAPGWLMRVLGAGLAFNGAHILFAAARPVIRRGETLYFALGDLSWVVGTAALIGLNLWITEPAAVTAAILVALWVGACGLAQWRLAPGRA